MIYLIKYVFEILLGKVRKSKHILLANMAKKYCSLKSKMLLKKEF